MHEYLIKSILFLGILLSPEMLMGCFCITPHDSLDRADIVFKGVANINPDFQDAKDCYYCLEGWVELSVDTVIKGAEYVKNCSTVIILQGSDNCAFSFVQDSVYLVYAKYVYQNEYDKHSSFPFLTTRQCTGTRGIDRKGRKALPNGIEMKSPRLAKTVKQNFNLYWIGWFLLSIMLNIILILFLLRVKRKENRKKNL